MDTEIQTFEKRLRSLAPARLSQPARARVLAQIRAQKNGEARPPADSPAFLVRFGIPLGIAASVLISLCFFCFQEFRGRTRESGLNRICATNYDMKRFSDSYPVFASHPRMNVVAVVPCFLTNMHRTGIDGIPDLR